MSATWRRREPSPTRHCGLRGGHTCSSCSLHTTMTSPKLAWVDSTYTASRSLGFPVRILHSQPRDKGLRDTIQTNKYLDNGLINAGISGCTLLCLSKAYTKHDLFSLNSGSGQYTTSYQGSGHALPDKEATSGQGQRHHTM